MKRGVHYKLTYPGMTDIPDGYEIGGVPVMRMQTARARGFWPFKWIEVGDSFFHLDAREQRAVLLHELGHCRLWHLEIRFLLTPLFWTRWVKYLAIEQELAADAFAKSHDYGEDLARYLRRSMSTPAGVFHPAALLRIDNLER